MISSMNTSLLKTEKICKHFGGIKAVDNVSIEIKKGEIIGIIGPNGAGKSTLINILTGLEKPDSGEIFLLGERITNLEPHIISKKGIRRSFQVTSNFRNENVFENITAAFMFKKYNKNEWENNLKKTNKIMERIGLLELAEKPIDKIPIACSKLVEICRCLVVDPVLVMLDEIAAGLTIEEGKRIVKIIKENKEKNGTSFILIEHRMDVLVEAADRVIVMDQGRVFYEGSPQNVFQNEKVIKLYFGG